MATKTIDAIRAREAEMAKAVTAAGDDAAKKRAARKALKRAQRLRRKMVAAEAKRAGKPKADAEAAAE